MRNIGQAVHSITQAIQRNQRHISLWHLLTLLITCPTQGDFNQALHTCEIGLQQLPHIMDDNALLLTNEEYEKASQQLLYQITRMLLLGMTQGPESALASSETLFAAFRKIAIPEDNSPEHGAHDAMIISGSLGNLQEIRRRGKSVSSSLVPEENRTLVPGRARSTSNLAATASLLTVPGEEHHHHHHHLHLFGSKSKSHSIQSLPQGKKHTDAYTYIGLLIGW